MEINYFIVSLIILILVVIFTVILTLKFSRVRSEGFNYFVQYILDLLYFSRLQSPYLIKKRFFIPVSIGYLISAIAFIGTILSFIVSDDNQIRLFIAIIFTILLVATFLYDKLAKKTNDLIINLNTDTKDLIYAYDELKSYEINRKFKNVFEDFTRYTSGIVGVQVYNYHLLSKKDTEAIKIEYEFGSVSEGASLNAILQEYYEYDRSTKDALIRANRKMEYIETEEDIEQVLSEMNIIEEAIIKSDYSTSSVAFYMIFLERLLDYLNEYNELFGEELPQQSYDHSNDSAPVDTLNQATNHGKKVATDHAEVAAAAATEAAATSPNNTENLHLDFSRISHNYKNGLFKSVVYSDIIRTKEMFSFTYNGINTSKAGRSYLFFKATSIKGETKLFLIVIKPEDLLIKKGKPYEDFVLEKFISVLSAHELIDNDSINLLKGGTVYDTTKRYGL